MSINNPVTHAVRYIKNRIPIQILNSVFAARGLGGRRGVGSVDAAIISEVIEGIVYQDCAIIGGLETVISIGDLKPYVTDQYGLWVRIPSERTQNKKILAVRSVSVVPRGTFGNVGYNGGYVNTNGALNQIGGIMSSIMRSSTSPQIHVINTATLANNGQNVVIIPDVQRTHRLYEMCVILETDTNFRHLHPKSYPDFSKLCAYACKMYIYNKMVIEINRGMVEGGAEISNFKEIIDSYESAAEDYETFLKETMEVVFMLNDPRRRDEYYYGISGGKR